MLRFSLSDSRNSKIVPKCSGVFFFKNHLRNKSQKDGASTAKLKHLWGRDLFSATQQQVFYTLVYFVVPGTLSIWQTLQPCFDLWKKTGFLKRSKVAPFPDIPQNFLESCVLLQSSTIKYQHCFCNRPMIDPSIFRYS